MPYAKNWILVDVFTVAQAAYLWEERDPPDNAVEEAITGGRPAEVAAIMQLLQGAIRTKSLNATKTRSYAEVGNDCFNDLITRPDLTEFARGKKQFPSFLFDTLGIDRTQSIGIDDPAPEPKESQTKNLGGRPTEYDWDGCIAEIVRIADMDGLPGKQNALALKLQAWFSNKYNREPAESEIKKRISPIYKNLKEAGWKPRYG